MNRLVDTYALVNIHGAGAGEDAGAGAGRGADIGVGGEEGGVVVF